MITRYFTSLTSTFNPLSPSRSHKIPRLVLSFLSADARTPSGGGIVVKSNILPSSSNSPSSLVVVFKDGKELRFDESTPNKAVEGSLDLTKLGVKDVVAELDRHSRALQRKAELTSS